MAEAKDKVDMSKIYTDLFMNREPNSKIEEEQGELNVHKKQNTLAESKIKEYEKKFKQYEKTDSETAGIYLNMINALKGDVAQRTAATAQMESAINEYKKLKTDLEKGYASLKDKRGSTKKFIEDYAKGFSELIGGEKAKVLNDEIKKYLENGKGKEHLDAIAGSTNAKDFSMYVLMINKEIDDIAISIIGFDPKNKEHMAEYGMYKSTALKQYQPIPRQARGG